MADDLIESDFTSIPQRLFSYSPKIKDSATSNKLNACLNYQEKLKSDLDFDELPEADLMPFDGSAHTDFHHALPFTEADYIELVDDTGRILRDDKRGAINSNLLPLLARMGIRSDQWLDHVKSFQRRYAACAGSPNSVRLFSDRNLKCWSKGMGISSQVYVLAR